MTHVLIVGTTRSGKTTLAGKLAQQAATSRPVLVLDPNLDYDLWGEHENIHITDDKEDFLGLVFNNVGCHVFVDEGRESGAANDPRMFSIATRGRHFGHKVHFLGQRAKQMHPDIRNQCEELFCFKQAIEDAKELALGWTDDEIKNAVNLKQGEFYYKQPFQDIQKLRLF